MAGTFVLCGLLLLVSVGGVQECGEGERHCAHTDTCIRYTDATSTTTPCTDTCSAHSSTPRYLCDGTCTALHLCSTPPSVWTTLNATTLTHNANHSTDQEVYLLWAHTRLNPNTASILYQGTPIATPAERHVVLRQISAASVLCRVTLAVGREHEVLSLEVLGGLVCKDDPLSLLRYGPGRRGEQPGCGRVVALGCSTVLPKVELTNTPRPVPVGEVCPASCNLCPTALRSYSLPSVCLDEGLLQECLPRQIERGCPPFHPEIISPMICRSVAYCPTYLAVVESLCHPQTHCNPSEASCTQENTWHAEQHNATHLWCVHPESGAPRSGTAVQKNAPLLPTCHIPATNLPFCGDRILANGSNLYNNLPLDPPCNAVDYMTFTQPVQSLVRIYDVTAVYTPRLLSAQKNALSVAFRDEGAEIRFSDDNLATHVVTSHSEETVRNTHEFMMWKMQWIERQPPPLSRLERRVERKDMMVYQTVQMSLAESRERHLLSTSNVTITSTPRDVPRVCCNLVHERRLLVARIRGFGNVSFEIAEAVDKRTTTSLRTGEMMRTSHVRVNVESGVPSGPISWGIYEPRPDGRCPLPDDNLFDPMRLGRRATCYTTRMDDPEMQRTRQQHCRVGDLSAKHGPFRSQSYLRDHSLPTEGWATIEGKILVFGTTPPICGVVLRDPIAEERTDWMETVNTMTATFSGSVEGSVHIVQDYPNVASELRVSLSAKQDMTLVSYHIATKPLSFYEAGCADYDAVTDVYDPYHVAGAARRSPEDCLALHPISRNRIDVGCPLGDLTPALYAARTLLKGGSVDMIGTAPFLNIDGNVYPALRNHLGGVQGKTLVLLQNGTPFACAPLLVEGVAGKQKEEEEEEEGKEATRVTVLFWVLLSSSGMVGIWGNEKGVPKKKNSCSVFFRRDFFWGMNCIYYL